MKTAVLKKQDIYRGSLILVNRLHPLHEKKMQPGMMLVPIDMKFYNILMEMRSAALLTQLMAAVSGKKMIVPVSGYRTREEQIQIYKDALRQHGQVFTKKYVALPGTSEHQTGLAIDLGENIEPIDLICPSFPYTGVFADFRRKAAQYGFIERYQQDKEHITGIAHEPWHFRYVGYPHAVIMEQNGLCLEEYIDFIKDYPYGGKPYRLKDEIKEVEVYYKKSDGEKTEVHFKDNDCYQISGNNEEGYIITVWR